jgi:DNA-binding IclR family transcriptional regulator
MSKSAARALDVLFAMAEIEGGPTTLTGLAERVRLPKSTTLRLLEGLEQRGLIARTMDGRLTLGFRVLALADAFHRNIDLGRRSVPYLRMLRDATKETAALFVALGLERACIERVQSESNLQWVEEVGRRFPLCSGSTGKVLTAFLPEEELDALLMRTRLPLLTPRSITSPSVFRKELERVRKDGYALSFEEAIPGVSGVSAPVRDHHGRVVAAMTFAGPSWRMTRERLIELSAIIVKRADALSVELGWTRPRTPRRATSSAATSPPSRGGRSRSARQGARGGTGTHGSGQLGTAG